MEIDLKTVNAAIVAGVPALILTLGAGITAFFVTRKVEFLKLKSQENIEKQRMEFLRESEAQKQRMELYKALYLERMAACKKIMEFVGRMQVETLKLNGEYRPSDYDEEKTTAQILDWIAVTVLPNQWLLNEDVMDKTKDVLSLVAKQGPQGKDDLEKKLKALCKAVADLMHSDDLSSMVKG